MSNQPPANRWTRDYVFDILRDLGIHYIFGVPGTNEIPIIDGCSYPENNVTYIECLHENIAIGAAMGYARMTGKPGILVVHVTPGIGHSLGNLFNAARSRVPLVIFCGQQQNELVTQEPLLASNLVQVANQYCKWAHELRSWEEIPLVLQRAFKEAMAPPTGPTFISFPWEFMLHEVSPAGDRMPGVTQIAPRFTGDQSAVKQAAGLLAKSHNPVIICGDAVGYAGAWPELQKLAQLLGAPVYLEGFSSLANFPNTDYHWQGELPGSQQQIQQRLAAHDTAFMCGFGAQAQLAVFKYSDGSLIPPSVSNIIYLTNNTWDIGKNYYGQVGILGDIKATLPELNALVAKHPPATADQNNKKLKAAARARDQMWQKYLEQGRKAKKVWGVVVAAELRELLLEYKLEKKFVYVHEAVSQGPQFQYYLPLGPPYAEPISYYCVEGGSLGWSMPASLGIKLGTGGQLGVEPEMVVNAVGDGSSLFYPQVWWTSSHREIPCLYLVMNNQEYHTLQVGLQQVVAAYGTAPGYNWQPYSMAPDYLTIRKPNFNFTRLAAAFGVTGGLLVNQPGEVRAALKQGFEHVLKKKQSFVLDIRVPHAEPPPGAKKALARAAVETLQPPPPLDLYYYREQAQAIEGLELAIQTPVIF